MDRTKMIESDAVVQHCSWRELFSFKDHGMQAWLTPDFDRYFEVFAAPTLEDNPEGGQTIKVYCLKCGDDQLPGMLDQFILGKGFEWGLVHGEGHCRTCGWPARAYHRVRDEDGEEVFTFTLVLQYHPDIVTLKDA